MVQSHLQIDYDKFKLYAPNPKATAKNLKKKELSLMSQQKR